MLINNDNYDSVVVEFVSYTGQYPCLCSGVLTLKINGETVKFGHKNNAYDFKTNTYNDGNYDKFWESGGSCGFSHGYSKSHVKQDEWIIDVEKIPEQYRKYAAMIDDVFNDNVDYGCCGGCL